MNCNSKNLQYALHMLNFEKIGDISAKVLICAQVQTDLIKDLLFDTF
jgi:hypothetical protein